jgi:glycosyltransferase involved in cell wall biosynthesis
VPIARIKLGVPSKVFRPKNKKVCRGELNIPPDSPVLLFSFSSLSDDRKGGSILKKAIQSLKIDNLFILLMGRKDIAFSIENAKIVELGYVNNVELMVTALNAADIYVGPSIEESFGQVFIEAAMCGTPSIGFNVTGVQDAIIQNVTGIKVNEVSWKALANSIESLLKDSQKLKRLGWIARLYAQNEFSLEASYHSFFSVLDKLGLIDEIGAQHKISFKKESQIITNQYKTWKDYNIAKKIKFVWKRCFSFGVNIIPTQVKAVIVPLLPNWLANRLIRWMTH